MDTSLTKIDPVKLHPHIYKVVLENDRVRVLEVTLKPGETSHMHSHPAMILYALADAKARFGYPDGKSEEIVMEKGDTIWVDGLTHEATNTGDSDISVLNIELK